MTPLDHGLTRTAREHRLQQARDERHRLVPSWQPPPNSQRAAQHKAYMTRKLDELAMDKVPGTDEQKWLSHAKPFSQKDSPEDFDANIRLVSYDLRYVANGGANN